jgi:type I restriction enzyme R subunit
MVVQIEKLAVEDYLAERLQEKGWRFVYADDLERDTYEEPLLIPNLVRALKRINRANSRQHTVDRGMKTISDFPSTVYRLQPTIIGDDEINRVVNELKLTGTGIEGAKRILNFYKFGVPVKFEREKIVKYVQLFDFEDIDNNEFIITRQVYYQGKDRIRTDIILYVNGIPIVDIECKNPTNISESWFNAYKQIKDYEKAVPELYKYVQIGVAAESQARYFPIVPWQEEVKTYEWKVGAIHELPLQNSIDFTIEMLSQDSLTDLIRNFLFFKVEFGNATKVITRYMQYRAANRMVERVIRNLGGEEDKDKGLIWHWQGSGKTLTMIFAANKLYYMRELENPTIFFIVDRIELEDQLYSEFYALDIVEPEIIGSVWELKDILKFDDYRSKRGVFIILIHKFRPEELKEVHGELEKVSRRKETIVNRRNVIAFVDEGHRTQYGLLAAQMEAILKNAFFFALTGTPISKRGRDTYLEFSYPPEEPYLDRYFITDSIKDGFTVKIVYQPRLEKDVHLKKDQLEAFLETELEELPEEIREGVEDKVKKKLNAIKLVLENPFRIKTISQDIAHHFKENIDGKFKAMVVAGSRKACAIYKEEFDKLLPKNYSEVITTFEREDEKVIQRYVAEAKVRYGGKDIEGIRKDLIEKFKEEEFPKILIVTDMLLTGFDAPILQVMYLDKLLKEHRLLQAVARTNRPFKDLKEAGLVLDYVGILKEFKRAFEMYSEEDVKGALFSYESVKEDFVALIKDILGMLREVPRDYERETLIQAIEVLTSDEKKEKEFVENYKNLRKMFELLGPDEIKLDYFEDYKWLSAIYTYYMKIVTQKPAYEGYVQRYYDKTIRFIHRSTEIEKLERELPTIAFDSEYLEELEEKVKGRKEKAANILFTLNRLVLVERHRNPIYESLIEKVERLLEMWREKTRDYEKIYMEGVKAVNEIKSLFSRQKSLGFSNLEYSMLLELEKKLSRSDVLVDVVKDLSKRLEKYMFFGWFNQFTIKKEVEREIRRFVRGMKGKYNLSLDEMNDLHEKLLESVKNYGTT